MFQRRCLAVAAALAIAAPGCSFVGIRPSPLRDRDGRAHCSTYVLPTVDLLVVAPVGWVGLDAYYQTEGPDASPEAYEADHRRAALIWGLGAALLVSSVYGYIAESRCRARR